MVNSRNLAPALMGLPFGLLLIATLWSIVSPALLVLWFAIKVFTAGIRCWLHWAYRRRDRAGALGPWENKYLAALSLDALSWTSLSVFFGDSQHLVVLAATVCSLIGIAAVATVALSDHFLGSFLFTTCLLLPSAAYLLSFGSLETIFACGSMVAFYLLMMDHGRRAALASEELLQLRFEIGEARDRALEAVRAKSEFLATMSHELRTPLNAVLGMATLLAKGELDPVQRSRVEVITTSGEALVALIGDVLDFSKIESGRVDLEKIPVRVVPLVEATLQVISGAIAEKGLELEFEVDGDIPQLILTDPTRLRQILLNLLSNAIKFTVEGRVAVRLFAEKRDGQEWLACAIEDSGIGITHEVQARLFAPFSQADASIVRRFGGTGLGLAISRRLCEALGGEISVESTPGKGSTFLFKIVAERVAEGVAEEVAEEVAEGVAKTEPPRPLPDGERPVDRIRAAESIDGEAFVLVVDDNPVNRLVTEELVTWLGYGAAAVTSGDEAMAFVAAQHVDVILMDLQMPELDGDVATRRLIASFDGAPHPVVIGLTASALAEDRQRCLSSGMADYLVKPVRLEALSAVLAGSRPQWPKRDSRPSG